MHHHMHPYARVQDMEPAMIFEMIADLPISEIPRRSLQAATASDPMDSLLAVYCQIVLACIQGLSRDNSEILHFQR